VCHGIGHRDGALRSRRAQAELLPIETNSIGFMPRILILAALPHSRPKIHRIERVDRRYALRLKAPRSVGLLCGSYPRLIIAWLTTQAVWTKNPEISHGRTPNTAQEQVRGIGRALCR